MKVLSTPIHMGERLAPLYELLVTLQVPTVILEMTGSNPPGPPCMGDLCHMGLAEKFYQTERNEVVGWYWRYDGETPIFVGSKVVNKGEFVGYEE